MDERSLEIVRELRSTTCRCGSPKIGGQTFCCTCYARLPRLMQWALYKRLGEGYAEACAEAAAFLDPVNAEAKADNDAKIARLHAAPAVTAV